MLKNIISASRRTDIPHYYKQWFENRRTAGYAEFRNAFGGKGAVSLRPEDVAGYLFWTKYAKPFHPTLASLLDEGMPCAFQYTITGLGASKIEPYIPRTSAAIDDFLQIRAMLPASSAIQWRYDPLVLSDELDEALHLQCFDDIATRLEKATNVVNMSFVEPYVKSIRRMQPEGTFLYRTMDAERHKQAARLNPDLLQIKQSRALSFLNELSACAQSHQMELRLCSNPEFGFPQSQCVSSGIFSAFKEDFIAELKVGPSRQGCRCLKAIDIGMDNSCIGGCKYCYVVTSQQTVLRNFNRHDPEAVMLRS